MEPTYSIDTTEPNRGDETMRQRIKTARENPTQPLWLGTTPEAGDPVTLSRTDQFDPILITGVVGAGKTTLCHQLATQQLVPESGLCYVSETGYAFDPPRPNGRARTNIGPGPYRDANDAIDAVPDDIGTTPSITNVLLGTKPGTDTDANFMTAFIEQLLINRHQQYGPDVSPYTLVLDGTNALSEVDPMHLRRLLAEARKLRLQILIVAQTVTTLPLTIQQWLAHNVRTYITSQVTRADAQQLAHSYPTVTADDLEMLPHYQWWMCEETAEGPQETQFVSVPPVQGASIRNE
jgi:hypothetical protein